MKGRVYSSAAESHNTNFQRSVLFKCEAKYTRPVKKLGITNSTTVQHCMQSALYIQSRKTERLAEMENISQSTVFLGKDSQIIILPLTKCKSGSKQCCNPNNRKIRLFNNSIKIIKFGRKEKTLSLKSIFTCLSYLNFFN